MGLENEPISNESKGEEKNVGTDIFSAVALRVPYSGEYNSTGAKDLFKDMELSERDKKNS